MTQNANQLFQEQSFGGTLRVFPTNVMPKSYASSAGAELLAQATPVAFNETTQLWVPWVSLTGNEIQTIGLGAASAGTITISFDGETTAAIAYDATAAAVQAALLLLSNLNPGDVVVSGTAFPGVLTLTFGGALANKDIPQITATPSGLTGGTVTIATTTAGASTGVGQIRGFVWPDPIQLHATNEKLGQTMLRGRIHYADIPLILGNTANQLKAALRLGPRTLGLIIEGLDGVH